MAGVTEELNFKLHLFKNLIQIATYGWQLYGTAPHRDSRIFLDSIYPTSQFIFAFTQGKKKDSRSNSVRNSLTWSKLEIIKYPFSPMKKKGKKMQMFRRENIHTVALNCLWTWLSLTSVFWCSTSQTLVYVKLT